MIALGETLGGDAGDRLFAGGVDGQDDDCVGVAECGAELFEQIAGAGVAVRLEDDMDAFVSALARGSERGANFRGMVAVVVDDGDAAGLTTLLEATVDAAETAEAFGDFFGRDFELVRDGYGGGGVEHVVAAGHVQIERAERTAPVCT